MKEGEAYQLLDDMGAVHPDWGVVIEIGMLVTLSRLEEIEDTYTVIRQLVVL